MEQKRSRLFYKARERVIDEIATRMMCERIQDEDDEHHGIRMPRTWMEEADKRCNELISDIAEESVREDEELGRMNVSSQTGRTKRAD